MKSNEDALCLQQIYSHLGVEAYGEDIQEQAVKEIDRLKIKNTKKKAKQLAISKLEMLHDMFCSTINNRILQNYVCSIIRGEIEELKNDGKL